MGFVYKTWQNNGLDAFIWAKASDEERQADLVALYAELGFHKITKLWYREMPVTHALYFDGVDESENTKLHRAAAHGDVVTVRALLVTEEGREMMCKRNRDDQTPREIARSMKKWKAFRLLDKCEEEKITECKEDQMCSIQSGVSVYFS